MAVQAQAALPPDQRLTAAQWIRKNLLGGWWNSILTIVTVAVLVRIAGAVGASAARSSWAIVTTNPRFWLVGLMPVEFARRAFWAGGLIAAAVILTYVGVRARVRPRVYAGLWAGILVSVAVIMSPVRLDQIGGLYLTVLLAVVGIAASFPIGVLAGIGRVSQLPVVKWFSTAYIELIRGIPFIAVLLWFSVFVTLVSGDALSRVQRAMIAITVFTSAYVGEIMRAGIQSVPRGQTEAARAVGLSGWQTMRFIVLPQAFKNMIPALVGQFISLFKDTSLTVIIGISELVGTGRALLARTEYLHDVPQTYGFLLVVYFIGSYAMSAASRRIEKQMGLGER